MARIRGTCQCRPRIQGPERVTFILAAAAARRSGHQRASNACPQFADYSDAISRLRRCAESAAIRRAEAMSRDAANVGALAFKRSGDLNLGNFNDATILRSLGEVPANLDEL